MVRPAVNPPGTQGRRNDDLQGFQDGTLFEDRAHRCAHTSLNSFGHRLRGCCYTWVFEGRSFPCGWRRRTKSCSTSLDWPAACGLLIRQSSSALMARQRHPPTTPGLDPSTAASQAQLAGRRPNPATRRPFTAVLEPPPAHQVLISSQQPRHHMTRKRHTPTRQKPGDPTAETSHPHTRRPQAPAERLEGPPQA